MTILLSLGLLAMGCVGKAPTPTATAPSPTLTPTPVPTPTLIRRVPFPTLGPGIAIPTPVGTPTPTPTPTPRLRGAVFSWTSMEPPDMSLITLSPPDQEGMVTVVGKPGAVPGKVDRVGFEWVALAGLDVGSEACIRLNPDGSFQARVYAPPGTTLLIAPRDGHGDLPQDPSSEGGLCSSGRNGDGTLVRVPDTVDLSRGQFITYGVLRGGRDLFEQDRGLYTRAQAFWRAEGDLSQVKLVVRGVDPNVCLRPAIKIERLFDTQGRPRAVYDTSVHGMPVTPTGLQVESRYHTITARVTELEEECIQGQADYDLTYELPDLTEGLPDGYYRARILPGGYIVDLQPFQAGNPFFSQEFEGAINDQGLYTLFKVGEPEQPYLPWVLFAETASQASGGSKGIVPQELKDSFVFGSRVTHTTQMILPRTHPETGELLPYRLEPWLPSLSGNFFLGFFPAIPLIPLELPGGWLKVTVERPDGQSETLGPATFRQSVSAKSISAHPYFERPGASHSFAGPNRTYGLTTGSDEFAYIFPSDGRYVIHIEGEIQDIWGNTYRGGGTYEVWVARALDMDLGVFMGTPLMVGEAYSPTVYVLRGVPAHITHTIRYYPNSDVSREVVHTIAGRANRYGYFHPGGEPFVFAEPGEYRVDVVASYTDASGNLWMAARTAASVVAPPKSPITAHGSSLAPEGRKWYFNNVLAGGCGEEACGGPNTNQFPLMRGDVVWFADGTNQQRPHPVLRDEQGVTGRPTGATELRGLDSYSESGRDPFQYPEEVTVWEYWYESAQRLGESVQQKLLMNESGHFHWYTSDNYNRQFGIGPDGDLPNDPKLLFGGIVHRGPQGNYYTYYAAMDITIDSLTEKGQRTCAPFQGAVGGPANCGPLMTLKGREVDLFITPTGVRPGTLLEVGDTFAFSGYLWPTLDSLVEVTVTKPSGDTVILSGRASPVGYLADSGRTFVTDEPGVYIVHVKLVHDTVVPSTGLAPAPPVVADGRAVQTEHGYTHPLSAILGAFDSQFEVYVVDPEAAPLAVDLQSESDVSAEEPVRISGQVSGFQGEGAMRYTARMPGFLLVEGSAPVSGGRFEIVYDPDMLAGDYPNLEREWETVDISLFLDAGPASQARLLHFRGDRLFVSQAHR